MTQKLKLLALGILLVGTTILQSFTFTSKAESDQPQKGDDVIIWLDTVAGYTANWSSVSGNDPYCVTVLNITTSTLHSMSYTTATSMALTGLQAGNSYRISVSKGSQTGFIICESINP